MNSTSAPFKLVIGLRKENINVEREVGTMIIVQFNRVIYTADRLD